MSDTYDGNPLSFPASLTLVTDGDPKNAASVRPGFEGLADRTAFLAALKHFEFNVSRIQRDVVLSQATYGGSPDWVMDFGSTPAGFVDQHPADDADASVATYFLSIPDGATVDEIRVKIKGGPGHSALPASMPLARFRKYILGNASTVIDTEVDSSASTGTYQSFHGLTVNGFSEVISNSNTVYVLEFISEAGGASEPGLVLAGIEVMFDTTKLDAGAA